MPGSRWWRPAGRYQRSCAFAVVAAVGCALLAAGSASASELPRERERADRRRNGWAR
jgi:hypothetical protein